jgi:hypothetical protein
VLENSKNMLKNLKQDKNLTFSQALEKKDIKIMSVCGIASSNKIINQLNVKSEPCHITDLTMDESDINKHELNIDQKNLTIFKDEHKFAVPNAVQSQTISCKNNNLNKTSSLKNESINAHELNVDEKNFSLLNTDTTNQTTQSNLTLNPHELNVDSKSITLLNMSSAAANQSSFLVNESSLNSHELNIDSRLVNMTNSRQLENERNFSSGSTTIDAHERNIDEKNITLINATQSMSHQNQSITAENQNNSGL